MAHLSMRTRSLGTETAFAVLRDVLALRAQGKDIANFCIGQPDFPTPQNVQEAAIRAIREEKHGYTPSAGIPELREAVARYFVRSRHVEIHSDDVVVSCGAKPFIAYAIASVTDAGQGQEVIFPNPGFPIYDSQIRALGAVPVPLPLRESRGFRLDPNDLRGAVTRNTRLLILDTPHNPTGALLNHDDLAAVAEIVLPFDNLWVLHDDPYAELVYPPGRYECLAAFPGMAERTILTDSVSKSYAMTGWRVGYAANRALATALSRWVTNTDSCAPHPNQWAAVEALNGPQDSVGAMRKIFEVRRNRIVEGLNSLPGVHCSMPGGAFYVWPNVTQACRETGSRDSEELRQRLLHEAGIAVLSDIHFGARNPGEGEHLRFSYASSMETIEKGLDRFGDFLRRNRR